MMKRLLMLVFCAASSASLADPLTVTCELWTTDKTVVATALAAMLADKRVDVTYVDNSGGSFWCKVQSLSIVG